MTDEPLYREFKSRREGMIYAMDGGLWMHRHIWRGRPMAHLVSTDKDKLLKDPRTGERRETWHWDLGGPFLPPKRESE